jgi:hypothetical protein
VRITASFCARERSFIVESMGNANGSLGSDPPGASEVYMMLKTQQKDEYTPDIFECVPQAGRVAFKRSYQHRNRSLSGYQSACVVAEIIGVFSVSVCTVVSKCEVSLTV